MALEEEIRALPWFHSIDFGNGIVSPGATKLEYLTAQADLCFPDSLAGKTVLDIGCWDGFYSFEAHRRGASRVLATDHFAWSSRSWGKPEAFELARRHIAPEVQGLDIELEDLSPSVIGTFDYVLFLGIFYHLRHPFWTLENVVTPLVKETLVLETHVDLLEVERPAMVFYPEAELNNDATNWWGPNNRCIHAMLEDLGFRVTHRRHTPARAIFHASRFPK